MSGQDSKQKGAEKGQNGTVAASNASGLGLDGLGDLSSLLDAPGKSGGPIEIDLHLIDEDVNQPRTEENPGFSDESLRELAETIKDRGVKTPISVRDNLDEPGRYILNHGARRFRGSKIAGKTTIPAFVDNDHTEDDQVIENLQRNDLMPRELADFIGRKLAKGMKKKDIAAKLGKSAAFVSQHATLLDLPESIARAFFQDRCRDVTVINELVTAHKKNPQEIADWLSDEDQEITRGSVKLLREFLDDKSGASGDGDDGGGDDESASKTGDAKGQKEKSEKEPDPDKLKKAIVMVDYKKRPARLMLGKRPSADGFAWLKYDDDGQEIEAELGQVKLNRLIEA